MGKGNDDAQGRIWFVTGASSGFGLAVGKSVLASGGRLVAIARDLAQLQVSFDGAGSGALLIPLDVTDAAGAVDAIKATIERFGRLDVIFNNAGYGHIGAAEELTEEELRRQLEVNLFGVINVTRAALPQMRKQRSGHIVQMSSLNGVEPLVGGAYYSASKFAIEGFSEALAGEVAHLGIKVTIVEPGPARTAFLKEGSAQWAKPIPDYAQSVGKTRAMLRELDGKQPIDPDRAARALVEAVGMERAPLRLPLGSLAVEHISGELESRRAQLDDWAAFASRADFPPASMR